MSPMSAEPSPRPWYTADENTIEYLNAHGRAVQIVSGLTEADTRHIVRCVNRSDAVDALVEAARWFVSDDYDPDEARQPLERLRAALAKLTEGET